MKLSHNEMVFLTVMAVSAPVGSAVAVERLAEYFDRPCKLRRAAASLARWGLITHDPYQGTVRLLGQPVLRALACVPTDSPELFPNERPLDREMALACGVPAVAEARGEPVPCVPEHAACVPEHKPRVPERGSHGTVAHLVTGCKSHLPSESHEQVMPEGHGQSALLVVNWLESVTDAASWAEWGGWWRVVLKNNPERILRAHAKMKMAGKIKFPARYMKARITEIDSGLG